MSREIAIRVEGLSKRYTLRGNRAENGGELWALENVSFEVRKGQSIGVIGPNGSGKSTLLKILAGVTRPSAGQVEITGRLASILDIGAGFHPELSGRENVFLNGQLLGFGKKEIRGKFERIVAFSEIGRFIDEPVKNYSNGMYLRLAFSIIAHIDADIYLFDEVLSVGDSKFRNKSNALFRSDEWRKDKTVIIISHNYKDLLFSTDHTLELEAGKLAGFGPTEKIIYDYEIKYADRSRSGSEANRYFGNLSLSFCVEGVTTNSILNSDELTVKLTGEKVPGTDCELGVLVRDAYDNSVFSVSPLQADLSMARVRDTFSLEFRIPGRFFNKGTFFFTVLGFDREENLFSYINAGVLEVQPEAALLTHRMGLSQGPLRPFFQWKLREGQDG